MADMGKTTMPNELNHKPKLGVCEENKEKNDCQLKQFAVKGLTLEACRRTVMRLIVMIFTTWILHNINVLVL